MQNKNSGFSGVLNVQMEVDWKKQTESSVVALVMAVSKLELEAVKQNW